MQLFRTPSPRRHRGSVMRHPFNRYRVTNAPLLSIVLAVLVLMAGACTWTEAAAPSAQPEPPAEEAATAEPPAPTATPVPPPPPAEPPRLALPEAPVPQGGSFAAIISGDDINDAVVFFAGRSYQAVADGGGWLALIGVGQRVGLTDQHPAGGYPVQASLSLTDGTTRSLSGSVTVTATRFPVESIVLGPSESALLDPGLIQREITALREIYGGFTPQRRWDGFFARPAGGELTDVFGSRRSYNGGPATGSHSGVDFGANAGAPVVAAATGRVEHAGPLPVRGNGVIIDHGAGVFTGYFHLSAFAVRAGEDVSAGARIGSVGSTGLATGPHLHWEVVIGGYHVNGLLWLLE